MGWKVIFNWKTIAALLLGTSSIILVSKMNSEQATEVSIHAIDAVKSVHSDKDED